MPGLCRAPGCDSPTTSRYSVSCSRHQSRLRRQGDVAQEAISKADLKGYLKLVRQRTSKNPDSPAWGQLEARWLAVIEHANGVVASFRAGKAGGRYVRKAAEEVLKVAAVATPRDVIETVLAISMMEELDGVEGGYNRHLTTFRSGLGLRSIRSRRSNRYRLAVKI